MPVFCCSNCMLAYSSHSLVLVTNCTIFYSSHPLVLVTNCMLFYSSHPFVLVTNCTLFYSSHPLLLVTNKYFFTSRTYFEVAMHADILRGPQILTSEIVKTSSCPFSYFHRYRAHILQFLYIKKTFHYIFVNSFHFQLKFII